MSRAALTVALLLVVLFSDMKLVHAFWVWVFAEGCS